MTLPRCIPPPVKTWNGSTSSIGGSVAANANANAQRGSSSNNNHLGTGAGGGGGGAGGGSSSSNNANNINATNGTEDNEDEITLESDLELLGRTVHAVSSALTEPPKENDRFMIYDVSFNPKGCVWDALIVVQLNDDGEGGDDGGEEEEDGSSRGGSNSRISESQQQQQSTTSRRRDRSSSRNHRRGSSSSRHRSSSSSRRRSTSRNNHRSMSRSKRRGGSNSEEMMMLDGKKSFSFPIKVTCAEDDNVVDGSSSDSIQQLQQSHHHRRTGQGPHPKRAKTYAVDLAVIDDMPHHPISSWSTSEAAEHRDDIKNAMEWVSFGIRRSMARSMFPQFPEGCQGRPFREIYQLNKKVSVCCILLLWGILVLLSLPRE